MSFIRAQFQANLQVVNELLPSVKKECGGCLPSALTFEESVQHLSKYLRPKQRNFVVSFLPCDHVESFHREILIDVWVLKSMKEIDESEVKHIKTLEELKLDDEDQPLTIYLLTRDLKDYLHFNPNKCYMLKAVTAIPLQKVTIGALSVDAYEWAKDNLQEFLMESIDRRLVLVKQHGNLGEVFTQSDHQLYTKLSMLMILECQPVMQGLLTPETMLVVLDIHHADLDKWQLRRLMQQSGGKVSVHLPLLKMPRAPQLTIPQPINLDEPDAAGMLGMHEYQQLQISMLKFPYHCAALPHMDSHIVDIENKIWLTRTTMTALQLNMGTWVRVSTSPLPKPFSPNWHGIEPSVSIDESFDDTHSAKIKLAQVFPIEDRRKVECVLRDLNSMLVPSDDIEFQNGTAYISPVFLFNILPSHLDNINSLTLSIERAEVGESPPVFAHDVSISLIASPWIKNPAIYDLIFSKHFTTPRLVSPDDVLCIYCNWRDLDILNTQAPVDEDLPRSHMLYFKVNSISGPDGESLSYFVDSLHSKLFQAASKQSYIPTMAEYFVQNSATMQHEVPSFWLTTQPGGLNDYVTKLENILKALILNHQRMGIFPVLVSGPTGVGKKTIVMATSRRLHVQVIKVNCYEICSETTASVEARLRNLCQKAFSCAPCILLFDNIDCLDKGKDAHDKEPRIVATLMLNLEEIQKVSPYPVLVVGVTSKRQNLTADLRSCFLDEIEVQAPSEAQRAEILQALSTGYLISPSVSFKALASHTAGLVLADFCALFSETVVQAQEDVMAYCKKLGLLAEDVCADDELTTEKYYEYYMKSVHLQKDICSAGILLHQTHFDKAISILQAAHSDSIGAPKIPNVSWHDIGGLSNVKEEILKTIELPFQYPELFAAGLQRSGILLYGPPGTGKTLVAKAVATECSLNFLSVKGPELINMYVGQSEENVREIFSTAARAAPCVIFFDELDSLAPNRGRSGDSGGVMDRVVSQLLAELDGMQKSRDVFVIGATNRPDLLDPALLRPGRFDTLLYLGISQNKEDKLKIMKALTRKFDLSDEVDLEKIVEKCPGNLTGADFYALCSTALQNAIRRRIKEQNTGPGKVDLIQEDFEEAITNLAPSVSQDELARYDKIQRQFANRKQQHSTSKPVDAPQEELELDGPPLVK